MKYAVNWEARVYDFMYAEWKAKGRPPTVREIARACGLSGVSHAAYYRRKLERAGCIVVERNRARAVRFICRPQEGTFK